MLGNLGGTHAHDFFKVISFDDNRYITFFDKSLCTCDIILSNLHIKQTEISQKRSK